MDSIKDILNQIEALESLPRTDYIQSKLNKLELELEDLYNCLHGTENCKYYIYLPK